MIEGPKNAEFQAYRKATEDEPGSDFDEPEESDMEDVNDEGGMNYVEKDSEHEDEEGSSDMEGIENV